MTEPTPTIQVLLDLSPAERQDALEELVVTEFRATLLMADDEDLPLDESYFDLGFTSLRISEIKERLEAAFGRAISTTQLFNSPTVEQLLAHLTGDVLADLFGGADAGAGLAPAPAGADQWDDLMKDLYQA
jgi:acyl carrier protein